MATPAELLARMLETQPPNYADEKARLGASVGPNDGDMAAVAETDPTTWQGRLRGMGLESFIAPYEALQPAADTTYGTMLPIARDNATGDYRLALPTMARDVATGWLDMLTGMQTGEITPAASAALQATGLPMASPSGSLASGGALRQFQAATPYGAKTAAQKASIEAGRQAWMWKTPAGKFVVNAGKKPEGAKLVGRAIGDEWVSGPGLMAKAGSKEGGAAQAAGKSLPMDEAARMARAKAMGFDVDAPVYHGTRDEITRFDPRKIGTRFRQDKEGFFFTGDAKLASDYAYSPYANVPFDGANVIPALTRMENPYIVNVKNYSLPSGADIDPRGLWDLYGNSKLLPVAKATGADGVLIKGRNGDDLRVVFDPKNIRSRFANFDPAKADSADLMAARTGSPELISTLLMQQRPPRQAENDDWLRNNGA